MPSAVPGCKTGTVRDKSRDLEDENNYELLLFILNLDVSWCDMVMWTTLSYHYFYCTGHQPLLSDIRFEAAFVGLRGAVHGVFSTALSTFLILLNTFTSQTLCVVGLPLLLFAKQRLSSTAFSNVTSMQNGIEGGDKGPLLSTTDVDSTYRSICRLCLLYTVCRTFKVQHGCSC